MSSLITSLKDGIGLLKRKDDDSFDRFSNRYTIAFLVTCSLFLVTKNYVGDPIDCFTPKEFHDNWVKYADNYCWIKNTYYVPMKENIPITNDLTQNERLSLKPELTYYQWVPIIIAFMVLIMSTPVFFWRMAMKMSGYDIQSIVKVASSVDNLNPEKLDSTCSYLVAQLDRHITYHRNQKRGKVGLGNGYGRFLYIMYVLTKCLYIAVPFLLLFLLSKMMGEGYGDYGLRAMKGIVMENGELIENPMFPRVTLCDFKIRRMGENIHPYTVQCVLTVNLFNERVFFVIWWWLYAVAVISILGLVVLLLKTMLPNSSTRHISKFLVSRQDVSMKSDVDQRDVAIFANEYLAMDGVFCMRLLAQNLPDIVTAEIVGELFKKWRKNRSRASSTDGSTERLTGDK